jgi:Family of unknown function (DUF6159)
MSGRLKRGWSMARASYAVLRRYPKLAVFPVISGAILLMIVGAIAASLLPHAGSLHDLTHGIWDKLGTHGSGNVWFYVSIAAVVYGLTAVMMFCNVALIHCALQCHAGQAPSIRTGLAAATVRLPQILGWALVSLTVGFVLELIENTLKDNLGIFGSLIGGLFDVGWVVITYFVLPVLAAEGTGPIAAIRRSSAIVKERWGESLAGEARFGLLGVLFFLQALAMFFVGLAITLSHGPTGLAGLGPLLMVLGALYGLGTIVVVQALSTIFQAGVYIYASTGVVPASLDRDLIEGAFRRKG